MIEHDYQISSESKAIAVSLICEKFEHHQDQDQTMQSLDELRELLRTLGIVTLDQFIQNKKKPDPATMLGSGKIEEISQIAKELNADLLVFDFELTASQVRNIKKISGLDVIDRNTVILEIFAKHARTAEARIQIEISRLEYLLPRLTSMWGHLGRQKGGIGVRGGEGEQQIELDRRIIREKIERYKRQLVDIVKGREQRRKKRSKKAITAALVGYTNAGKSSLMNRLCKQNVLEEDKLFATLDSTYRMLNPDTKPPMILIDTVGFISNLPSSLINGFKTTLESALEADLIIIVCDISSPHYQKDLKVTEEVLAELNVRDKETIIVFNKKDKLDNFFVPKIAQKKYVNSFIVSSFDAEDMKQLRAYIINFFLEKQDCYDLFIPYQLGEAHSLVRGQTNIISTETHQDGIFYRVRVPEFIFARLPLKEFLMAPTSQELK